MTAPHTAPMTQDAMIALPSSKTCSRCKEHKPISEFNIWRIEGKMRPCARCHDCRHATYQSEHYRKVQNAKFARARAAGRKRVPDRKHAAQRELLHPEKRKASRAVLRAIKRGALVRPTVCEACGREPPPTRDGKPSIQGHHRDYTKRLDVTWLCIPCHVQEHRNER